ncbi:MULTISPECIES: DUF6434 domain-containing protein [unclassified Pseudomonas]|uniref:DUF6434 domain-containing protein n=1 Tax=unclassified Pseudomonas TaxID=196821 RepID=UPI002119AA21|nr:MULTISPECIES: DUF6434 domain-containing protein [unclassified Pseudomonas]
MDFNWHSDPITRSTPITPLYKNTQNVRRFMLEHCGPGFKFDRAFMAWISNDTAKTLGDMVDEWQRRNAGL